MQRTPGIRSYQPNAGALAFPLGGIGTGTVGLGARGNWRDWEIFNRSAKGNSLSNTFFAIRTQTEGGEAVTRVLEGPVQPPFDGGHGFSPQTGAGLPRFNNSSFHGEYPFGWLELSDENVPLQVTLEAYTPLIPLNPDDSGIPCAVLTYTVQNTSDKAVNMTLVGSFMNPVGCAQFDPTNSHREQQLGKTVNEYHDKGDLRGLFMRSEGIETGALEFGDLSLVTNHPNVTYKRAWMRGAWFDFLQEFWDDLNDDGLLTDLGYETGGEWPDTGSLGVVDTVPAGESRSYTFVLTWSFPNRINSWSIKPERIIRNHYAVNFADSWVTAEYVIRNLARLETGTRQFHDALFNSTLPAAVVDALSANIVPVRSNTCFWLEDGRFFGWEGCNNEWGSCAGNCTHVWSYAYTVAFLFPSLEREMRRIEFVIETEPSGYMSFRAIRALDENSEWIWAGNKIAAVDGQMGCILRAYREYQLCGDKDWLATVWPGIKNAIDYASKHWDTDGDSVLDGKQHNTYDIEFYGPNPLCSVYYLAGLRAVEEMAKVMGDTELAQRCHASFENGSAKLDSLLWNGEYYAQVIEDVNAYKYQYGAGVLSDQLLGQLHARALGLGDLLPVDHVKTAIKSVFDYNFRRGFSKHVNLQRVYALNDEAGLILCTWPRGGRPRFPFVYSDEVWTGIEYQVAAHLIYEGWTQEGLTIVESLRQRHDGVRRNPWNEVECGHHYARSMASWTLLLALSGAHTNLGENSMTFAPVADVLDGKDSFTTLWTSACAWGTYTQQKDASGAWQPFIEVLGGDASGVTVKACGKAWTL